MKDWFIYLLERGQVASYIEFLGDLDGKAYTIGYARFNDDKKAAQSNYGQDHYYFAWCPELIGCMTDAATASEAISNLQNEAIPLVVSSLLEDGRPVPKPGSHRTVTL